MKTLLLCCWFLCFGITGIAQNKYEKKTVQVLPESHLKITGDTNISKFKCDFNTARLERTQGIEYRINENHIDFRNVILTLDNDGFDCGNKAINKDFHTLLKTEHYPQITLELSELHMYNEQRGNAYVTITIAGIQKNYTLPIDIHKQSSFQNYAGKLQLDIRDFNLEPPKKMFGLIVIKDEIEIDFNLAVKIR